MESILKKPALQGTIILQSTLAPHCAIMIQDAFSPTSVLIAAKEPLKTMFCSVMDSVVVGEFSRLNKVMLNTVKSG